MSWLSKSVVFLHFCYFSFSICSYRTFFVLVIAEIERVRIYKKSAWKLEALKTLKTNVLQNNQVILYSCFESDSAVETAVLAVWLGCQRAAPLSRGVASENIGKLWNEDSRNITYPRPEAAQQLLFQPRIKEHLRWKRIKFETHVFSACASSADKIQEQDICGGLTLPDPTK